MDWLDRNLQHEFLSELYKVYPDSITYDYYINAAIAQTSGVIEAEEDASFVLKQSANLQYLAEHGLVVFNDKTRINATVKITAKGIDFLMMMAAFLLFLGLSQSNYTVTLFKLCSIQKLTKQISLRKKKAS